MSELHYTHGVAEGDDPTCRIGDIVASWEFGYGAAGHVCGIDPMARVLEVIWDDGRAKVCTREWKHVDKLVFQYHIDSSEPLECLDAHKGPCTGEVAYRPSLSPTGKMFARCDGHWEQRVDKQQEIDARYPATPPTWFDPAYAGEVWDEEDY